MLYLIYTCLCSNISGFLQVYMGGWVGGRVWVGVCGCVCVCCVHVCVREGKRERLRLYVSFAKEPYERDYILQKRPMILRREGKREGGATRERERYISYHMYMYACVRIEVHAYVKMFTYASIYICIGWRLCQRHRHWWQMNLCHVCIHVHVYICTCIYMYIRTHVRECIFILTHTYTCIYI